MQKLTASPTRRIVGKAGHNSGKGVARDAQKLAMCNELGVTLFRLPTSSVCYDEVRKIWDFVKKGEIER